MNTHANKTQEDRRQSVSAAGSPMPSGSESTFQFVDNRPEAAAQRKLRQMANNSPQTKHVSQLRRMADVHLAPGQNGSKGIIQLARERDEETVEKTKVGQAGKPIQRVVDQTAVGERIIIDLKTAPDYGDTGTIIRPSRVKNECMAVQFDNEPPQTLYRVYYPEMSVIDDTEVFNIGNVAGANAEKLAALDKAAVDVANALEKGGVGYIIEGSYAWFKHGASTSKMPGDIDIIVNTMLGSRAAMEAAKALFNPKGDVSGRAVVLNYIHIKTGVEIQLVAGGDMAKYDESQVEQKEGKNFSDVFTTTHRLAKRDNSPGQFRRKDKIALASLMLSPAIREDKNFKFLIGTVLGNPSIVLSMKEDMNIQNPKGPDVISYLTFIERNSTNDRVQLISDVPETVEKPGGIEVDWESLEDDYGSASDTQGEYAILKKYYTPHSEALPFGEFLNLCIEQKIVSDDDKQKYVDIHLQEYSSH